MNATLPLTALAALLVGMTAPVRAAERPVALRVPAPVAKDIAAMPQIAEPVDDAERRINAALQRLDSGVRKAAATCKAEGGAHSSWERAVDATMRGPRFLSLTITDNVYCGGAHPNASTMAIVYDLATGAPVDWTTLLPPALTGTLSLATGADGTRMVTLASKRLYALYLKNYRPRTGDRKVDADDKECREAVASADGAGPPAMMAWLDAKAGGLAVQFDLPHAVQACADPVVIPAATLRQEGAKPLLTDALEAARTK